MKIQNLAVIFIIIILPISMISTVYIQNQIKTLELQTSYDSKLNNATYDALKAFQLNTVNSSTSDLSNSKIRDIEASVNSFFNSISSNFNMAGYNRDILKEYVPALVYTMYDGYYIYSPYYNAISAGRGEYADGATYKPDDKISGLKPYIYYSCRYKKGTSDDFVITYSLDNYITIQGKVNGKAVFDYGYLINDCEYTDDVVKYRDIEIESEYLRENIFDDDGSILRDVPYTKINGVKYYKDNEAWYSTLNGEVEYTAEKFKVENDSAQRYYKAAKDFKKRIIDTYNLENLTSEYAVDEQGKQLFKEDYSYKIFNFDNNGTAIEEPNSDFNQHRLQVIRYSIERNLSIAIANYNKYGGVSANFLMPELKEDEWEKILNNISIISFLQGLNIGGKVYNGYSIITNTKNEEVVGEDSIYITTDDGQYHKATDSKLGNGKMKGVFNIDFERKSFYNTKTGTKYYYPKEQLGCYNCIVNHTNVNDTDNIYDYMEGQSKSDKPNLAKEYFTALGRERYGMYKSNNNNDELKEQYYEK